ncbi:MAG: hypothetical protein M1343_13125 [Chloroflexi bacterium]|nr:hypothetical protein [Chloroflexota bacterium]MDA8188064.1 hypothetical protein [Dehalococcoidales bacterium]
MRGYKNLISTTYLVGFRVTDEEKTWVKKMLKRLQKEGDYCQSDLARAALIHFIKASKNRKRFVKDQIDFAKGGRGQEDKESPFSGIGTTEENAC